MSRVAGSLGPEGLRIGGRAGSSSSCAWEGRLEGLEALAREVGLPVHAAAHEIVAAAFAERGTRILDDLGGTFALAVWDERRGEGMLAADRLGTHSVFLRREGAGLRFSSRIADLGADEPEPAAVSRLIAYGMLERRETLLRGVERLAGGEAIVLRRGGWSRVTYWAPRYEAPIDVGLDEAAELVRRELRRAVGVRCGERPGLMLSGGLDSAAVAATAPPAAMLRAYSALFPDHPQTDERKRIERTAAELGLESHVLEVRGASLLQAAADHAREWRLPAAAPTLFFQLPLLGMARADGVTVLLDGQGGDELFGGSPALAEREPLRDRLRRLVRPSSMRPRTFSRPDLVREDPGRPEPLRLDGPGWWTTQADQLTAARERAGVHDHLHRKVVSRGLRGGHPLLDDLPLIELVLRLPPRLALDGPLDRPVLRAALRGLVGDHVRQRPTKMPFDRLLIDCLLGHDRTVLGSLLDPRRALVAAFVRPELLARCADPPPAGAATVFQVWTAWRLASVELWLRELTSEQLDAEPLRAAVSS
jgi:asparagine synthase (glutamine-hydrolysing)